MGGTLSPGGGNGFLGPTQQAPESEGFLSEEVTNSSGSGLAIGEVVRIVTDDAVTRAQADVVANVQGTIGAVIQAAAAGALVRVNTEGKGVVLLEAALVPVAGQTLWVSPTVAGRATNVQPAANLMSIGVIKDASTYATDGTVVADIDIDTGVSQPPSANVNKFTYVNDEAKSHMSTPGVPEAIVYEDNINLDDAPGVLGIIRARLSAIVRVSGAGTGTYRLYTGAAAPGSLAGATLRATITTVNIVDEQQTNLGAAFANPGGQRLMQITAQHSVNNRIARIRGVGVAIG